jgi:YfiH family protein
VLEVGRGTPDRRGPEADGLISRDRETVLSVTVADCLPVFLYDTGGRPEAGTGGFALVHSGWKGTGIALEALRLMEKSWHTRPGDIAAILGPCIRRCCYQVDDGRARAFEAGFGGTGGGGASLLEPAAFETGGKFFLDLQAANIRLLAGAGVRNIAVCEDCTFTDERLGSFRREGPGYTRMAALAGCFQ